MKNTLSLIVAALFLVPAAATAAPLTFTQDIHPIFEKTCYSCHGEKKQKGKFRADTREGIFKKTDAENHVVVPGKPGESDLIYRLTTKVEDDMMPPVDAEHRLTPEQIETVRKWVEQGAVWSPDDKPAESKPGESK